MTFLTRAHILKTMKEIKARVLKTEVVLSEVEVNLTVSDDTAVTNKLILSRIEENAEFSQVSKSSNLSVLNIETGEQPMLPIF